MLPSPLPTQYTYLIYSEPELIAATIVVDAPLPHIEVGHQLLVGTETRSTSDKALVIEQIRVALVYREDHLRLYEIHVFCRERDVPETY